MNIVFDLDGTLIHSAPDIHAAANRMLAGEGAAPLDMATLTSFIGNGIPKLVERAMRAREIPPTEHARLTQVMLDHYAENPATLTRLYPGIATLLPALKQANHKLGICTNKPEAPTRQILDLLGIADLFDVIIGGDSLGVKKPDPAPLQATFMGLGQDTPLYVGDSEVDAETAQRAEIPFALFTQGYRKVAVDDLTHAYRFDSFHDLAAIVAKHGQAAC